MNCICQRNSIFDGIVTKVNETPKIILFSPKRLLYSSSNPKMNFLITFILLANSNLDAVMLPPLPSVLSDIFPSYPFVGEKNIEEKHE